MHVTALSALLLTGTVGSGKSTVAEHVGKRLAEKNVPHAVIDMDRLRNAWPAPGDDRFNMRLAFRNLAAVTANFVAAGVRKIVIAGVVESPAERARYSEALAMPLAVCRLHTTLPTVHRRLSLRHAEDPRGLQWHLARAGALDRILASAGVEDFTEETTDRPVCDIADHILIRLEWLSIHG